MVGIRVGIRGPIPHLAISEGEAGWTDRLSRRPARKRGFRRLFRKKSDGASYSPHLVPSGRRDPQAADGGDSIEGAGHGKQRAGTDRPQRAGRTGPGFHQKKLRGRSGQAAVRTLGFALVRSRSNRPASGLVRHLHSLNLRPRFFATQRPEEYPDFLRRLPSCHRRIVRSGGWRAARHAGSRRFGRNGVVTPDDSREAKEKP